ncbi:MULTISPECIES: glycosyltransferase [unclassified Leptolyngbya]|uniref:glycosyltransferase n=1 Tax=unclassified Leptolyngbya TaxID=2650499 RepID=UPI001683AEA8|nr:MULTISPECIES: glycosyltransferase [unclassified Leptolyngbya]MBD1909201.1 glycosyltransferase [Leptolyngbya sp. FACHB-8]MBD2153996.1 glycosyltransferase [Leptolyngbya sp. FACHB-16]
MRVTFVAGGYQPQRCGVADYLAHLRTHLAKQGVESQVVTSQVSAQAINKPDVIGAVDDWAMPNLFPLVRTLMAHPTDVLHIQHAAGSYGFQRPIFLLPLLLRSLGYRPPIVTTAHEYGWWEWTPSWIPAGLLEFAKNWGQQRGWWDREDGWLLTGSEAIITTNENIAAIMRDRLPQLGDRLHSIPIAANVSVAPIDRDIARRQLRQTCNWPEDTEVIAFFGFLHPVKGIETLLQAVQKVVYSRPNVRLLLLGGVETLSLQGEDAERYWQKIQACIAELQLSQSVHCTGYIDAEQASHYLSGADIGVLPFNPGVTLKSGSLLTLLAHRLPTVIAESVETDPVLMSDLVKRVSPRCVPSLANALLELLDDCFQCDRLSENGYRFVQSRTWEAIALQHHAIYQKVINQFSN